MFDLHLGWVDLCQGEQEFRLCLRYSCLCWGKGFVEMDII